MTKEQVLVISTTEKVADALLEKTTLKRAKRVIFWCLRFFHNSKSEMLKVQRKSG